MKRRDVLKGMSLLAGSAVLVRPAWTAAFEATPAAMPPVARSIRGLKRIDGRLRQPLRIALPPGHAGGEVTTSVNGVVLDTRTVTPADAGFDLLLDPVTTPVAQSVAVALGGTTQRATVTVLPVRQMQVYILPHSHHDLGYTATQADVQDKQVQNIVQAIELARQTAGNPEGSRFVWNLEVLWGADLYMQRKAPAERQAFLDAVRSGGIALHGAYANELTGLCRPEELVQLFRYGTELAALSGTRVDSAMMSDVPGYTWGTVSAMAQAGIRYFSAAPNYFDRIGRFMATLQDKPFWWVSPSGRERVLFWIPWTGYAMSHVMQADDDWVGKYQQRMDDVRFPYDVSYVRWAGHGDNAEPDPGIVEFTRTWNQAYEWPKFTIASTSTAFAAFEQRHGAALAQLQGDLTPYWEDGAASSALETSINRNAADRLAQAATLLAMRQPGNYRPADFRDAWRDVLLYSEHTWGAAGSVTQPEDAMTTNQWTVKRQFALDAQRKSRTLLSLAAGPGTHGPGLSGQVEIANTASWPRSGVVRVPRDASAGGDRVVDVHGKAMPSQRLASGELAILVPAIPATGSIRLAIGPGTPAAPARPVVCADGVLSNEHLTARIDPKNGNVVALSTPGGDNLVDQSRGWSLNQFVLLRGEDVAHLQSSGPARVRVEDAGPLVATLCIDSPAPLCNGLARRVSLAAGQEFLELANTVDKQRAAYDDSVDARGRHPVRKESIQFAFPFAVAGGGLAIDVPFATVRPELDQLPGSCKNWMPVGRYVDVSNGEHGVTWATLDAPLVEVGGITATKLNSQTDPSVWMEHLAPTQSFFSWVMNNHWGTNYRAWQEGPVTFRYAVRPHQGSDAGEASRFATGLTQPLLVVAARGEYGAPLLRVEPAAVIVQELKPSDDGSAWIVRLFNSSATDALVNLHWSPSAGAQGVSLSGVAEQRGKALAAAPSIGARQLVTLRVERG